MGIRGWERLERQANSTPVERARYFAVAEALTEPLQPRDGLEQLLVHQVACAHELHLRRQATAAYRVEENTWQRKGDKVRMLENMSARQRARYEAREGWLPPRQSQADAIEQAVQIAKVRAERPSCWLYS